jgi:hypothetical protein
MPCSWRQRSIVLLTESSTMVRRLRSLLGGTNTAWPSCSWIWCETVNTPLVEIDVAPAQVDDLTRRSPSSTASQNNGTSDAPAPARGRPRSARQSTPRRPVARRWCARGRPGSGPNHCPWPAAGRQLAPACRVGSDQSATDRPVESRSEDFPDPLQHGRGQRAAAEQGGEHRLRRADS